MILGAVASFEKAARGGAEFTPAWKIVERAQRQRPEEYWLVTQPDHAHLSGRIAEAFDRKRFPLVTPELIACIGSHDEGWRKFDGAIPQPAAPRFDEQGKPVTFIDLLPDRFTQAWRGSIENALRIDSFGAAVVSKHFLWLADHRLKSAEDTAEDREQLTQFISRENERQEKLVPSRELSQRADEALEILQFCDLLSLLLCCGASENAEFPQAFGGSRVRASQKESSYVLSPSPLSGPVSLQCPAFIPNGNGSFAARSIFCELI